MGHFLNYFVTETLPRIVLLDTGASIDLRTYYTDNQRRNDVSIVTLPFANKDEVQEFHLYHVMLRKQLRFLESGGLHWMFQAANQRVVKQDPIDGQLGLKYVGEDADCVYIGLVVGNFLETSHVNQERTGFTFGPDEAAEIHKAAVSSAKVFLAEYIERIRRKQVETTNEIIRENPQFLPFRNSLEDFVESNLSLNTQGEEDIYLELSRRKLRAKRKLNGEIRSLKNDEIRRMDDEFQQITKALNDEKKSSLAEYVVRRKEILDLLILRWHSRIRETRKYYKEEVIHELIVPVRSSSEELDYDAHNLWILDDRLAFYSFPVG